jgi:hypothetical protein
MKKSLFTRLIGALIVMTTLVVGFAPAASAAVPSIERSAVTASVPASEDDGSGGSPAATTNACGNTSDSSGKYASTSPLLPVNRWADSTSNMHSRLDNTMFADTATLLQRHALISSGMSTGNFMWSLGTGLSSFAINFCMLDSMGGAADKIGATIGNAVLGSGLLAGIVVISVGVLLFQARRRGGAAWKTVVAKGAIVGLLAIMVGGAMSSTGGGADGSAAPYKPGLMSPGWVVTTLNKTVSSLASAPAAALAMPTTKTGLYDTTNPLGCNNYVQSLKAGYQATYGTGADKLSSGVPLIMSTLWEGTGLKTWRTAQFGTSGLDDNTYCHLLDWNSGVPVMGPEITDSSSAGASSVRGTMARFWGDNGYRVTNYFSQAWQPTDNVSQDRSMIGWSTCRLNDMKADPSDKNSWSIQTNFANGDKDKKVSQDDCRTWFMEGGDVPGAMDWPSGTSDVQARIPSDLKLRDFILTLHGNYNFQGMTSVFAYNLSALAMLCVFGAIAISIIVAKVAMVIMIITVFFLIIMCLLPSAGTDKLSGFVKMLLGMNIFVFGIQMIFALVAVISDMLQSMGATFLGGDGSLVSTFWTGLSPLMAVYLLHMMFTKVMKVPSPFKLSAGLAWGASTAAVGGAAAAGVGSLLDRTASRHGARAMGAAKRAGGRGLNSVMSAASGGRLGKGAATARRGSAVAVGAGAGAAAGVLSNLPDALGGKKGGRRGQASVSSAFNSATGEGGLSGDDLLKSNVPNSQAARGRMPGSDRRAMDLAAKDEQAKAIEWENGRRAELGLAPMRPAGEAFAGLGGKTLGAIKNTPGNIKNLPGNAKDALRNGAGAVADGAKNLGMEFGAQPGQTTLRGLKAGGRALKKAAVAAKYSNAYDQFKQKPLKTSAKAVGIGAALALTAPALAIPAVVAGGWAAKKGATALYNNTAGRAAIRDNRTQEYREAMRAQRAQTEKADRAAGNGPESATGPTTPSASSSSQREARPDSGGAGSPTPTTEQMPVV